MKEYEGIAHKLWILCRHRIGYKSVLLFTNLRDTNYSETSLNELLKFTYTINQLSVQWKLILKFIFL